MIQLFIDNQEVDINESVELYLNKTFNNLENPTTYYSEYSKTITLPFTAKNKVILDNYSRQDSVVTNNTKDPRKKTPFILIYNGKKVMDGYCKINNSNNKYDNKEFQVELYSAFALVMNELNELTFNKYETITYGGSKEDKYLITTPFDDIRVDKNLVKQSFEQETHNLYGEDVLDYIKFIPTYQGKYDDFESGKTQLVNDIKELPQERDEHYQREFRSYYQQPALWVNKLWEIAKNKLEEITDYQLVLDNSWFNVSNPYYTDLLYTCPNLFNKDDNFVETSSYFRENVKQYEKNIATMGNLSQHHRSKLYFDPSGSLYSGGIFNSTQEGFTEVSINSSVMILVHRPNNGSSIRYCKMKKSNNMYVRFSAINANTNKTITDYTYLLYSDKKPTTYSADELIDIGITFGKRPNINCGFPTGYIKNDGYWFEAPINLKLRVLENEPYYITMDCWFENNSKAFKHGVVPVLVDIFWTGTRNGYTIFNNLHSASCKTIDYLRSRSKVDMYRIYQKDTTLLNTLLNYSKMFGLLWDVDTDNKKVTVLTRNKFFSDYQILDWSSKVDRSRDFLLEPLCFEKRYVNFNVEEGKGTKLSNYYNKYGVGYGSKKIDTEYQFNSDTEDLFKGIQPSIVSKKSQSSIKYNTDEPNRSDFMGYNFKIYPKEHYVDNDNDGKNAENSGAFYFWNGTFKPDERLSNKSSSGYYCVRITDDTRIMMLSDEYTWLSNINTSDSTNCYKLPDISTVDRSGKYSVHFESPKEYYIDEDYSNTDYIYSLFWEDFINERYNIQNKKLTAYFYLSPTDYYNIRFNEFIKIQNTLYHINKVFDYDFDTNSPTKLELCQVYDLTAYTSGQENWTNLSVTPNVIEIYSNRSERVSVFSSDTWTVVEQPDWVTYTIENGNIFINAIGNPFRSRFGEILLNSGDLYASIFLYQRPNEEYLNLDNNNATIEAGGGTISVNIDSLPNDLVITNCPSWCSVDIVERLSIREDILQPVTTFTANINVSKNNSTLYRRGDITFSNGNLSKGFKITQIGQSIIEDEYNYQPINIDINDSGVWNSRVNKELRITSLDISEGNINNNSGIIDSITVNFTPTLNQTDVGDNTPEICSGGKLTVLTLDGIKVYKNYNYGDIDYSYLVNIGTGGGILTVNGETYTSNYYEDVIDGTQISVTANAPSDMSFVRWSDGNVNNPRTITVNSDIEIYPIYEDSGNRNYLFDNNEEIDFDNNENIIY